MKKLSIGDITSRAWDLAVNNWPVFIVMCLISTAIGTLYSTGSNNLTNLGPTPDPSEVFEAFCNAFNPGFSLLGLLLGTYVSLVTYKMLVNTIRFGKPYEELSEVLKVDLTRYALFLGAEILLGLAIVVGFTLCIIPGIYLGVRWMYVPVIAATEEVSIGEAFSRSWAATSGHFWKLLLMGIVAIIIIIIGFCACCVGVIFAEVVTNFMLVLSYFELQEDAPEEEYVVNA